MTGGSVLGSGGRDWIGGKKKGKMKTKHCPLVREKREEGGEHEKGVHCKRMRKGEKYGEKGSSTLSFSLQDAEVRNVLFKQQGQGRGLEWRQSATGRSQQAPSEGAEAQA
jgi:hypothetical protein